MLSVRPLVPAALLFGLCALHSLGLNAFAAGRDCRDYAKSPHAIEQEILARGAAVVLREAYETWAEHEANDCWLTILRHIGEGQDEWLRVAVKLRSASDAGSTSMILDAVADAIENNPAGMLRITDQTPEALFPLSELCGDQIFVSFDSEQSAREAIHRRRLSLEGVEEQDLANKRDACLRELSRVEKTLAAGFGSPSE